ncbi:TPA: LacI family DNA-binding transcriptional regulator [Morganella morganii]
MASLKDVARLASVSLMTVSRAINNPELLKPETLRQVQHAIDVLNYVPDLSARKIRGKNTNLSCMGVLAIDTASAPFSVEILLAIEQCARKYGWDSFVINISSGDDLTRAVRQILSRRPDGIIITGAQLCGINIPELLRDKNLVLTNCFDPDNPALPAYIPDDYHGQYDATEYLIRRGYRRPLCIWPPVELLSSGLRRDAVQHAWLNAGLSVSGLIQHNIKQSDIYYRDVITLIERYTDGNSPLFDCIICGNDQIAFIAYQVLLRRGISVPEQAGILGFENMTGTGELFYPPLTTICSPYCLLGEAAALHLIEERGSTARTYVPCRILTRDSL